MDAVLSGVRLVNYNVNVIVDECSTARLLT